MTAPLVNPDGRSNTRPTPIGSINSDPQLALTQSQGAGFNMAGYNPGNNAYAGGNAGKYATYLKLFSGEVFKAYESNCIAKGTVQNRTLTNGKSMQFIFTGRMTAEYHTPGTPILGDGNPPVAEKTIVMDDLLISSAFVYDLDETLAHYSLRGEISKKIGHALAEAYDKKVFRTIALSAREAHPVTAAPGPEPGGSIIRLGANNQYNAQTLVDAFFEAASILDEKNLPREGRFAVLSPRQYYALISQVDSNILNRDYGNSQGNLTSGGGLYEIAGIQIKRSNNLPFMLQGNGANNVVESIDGENNNYAGDFTTHAGLIYHKDAAAVLTALGPQVQTTGSDVRAMYQGDLIIGRLAMGAGTLNPACAIELQAAN